MAIERNFKQVRESLGLTQEEAANKIGIHPRTLQTIENGETKAVRDDTLGKICEAYNVEPGDLLKKKATK